MRIHPDGPPEYLRLAAGAHLIGVGESTLWYHAKTDSSFPTLRKLGARTTLVSRAELLAWVEQRAQKVPA